MKASVYASCRHLQVDSCSTRVNALLAHYKDLKNTEDIASGLMCLQALELHRDKPLNQGNLLGSEKRRALNDLCVKMLECVSRLFASPSAPSETLPADPHITSRTPQVSHQAG